MNEFDHMTLFEASERGRMESLDEAQYTEALDEMEYDDKAKTKVAFCKLAGIGGAKVDAEGAVVLLEECVNNGNIDAAWMLGLCCEYGIGTEQDIERAMSLYWRFESWSVVGMFLLKDIKSERGSGVIDLRKGIFRDGIKKRLGELICVAPWTSLDLNCEQKMRV